MGTGSRFSELLLKCSLGLIQLIKTQLMFALMAPERQASVISASGEVSAQRFYGLQMEGFLPQRSSTEMSLIHKPSHFNNVVIKSLLWRVGNILVNVHAGVSL